MSTDNGQNTKSGMVDTYLGLLRICQLYRQCVGEDCTPPEECCITAERRLRSASNAHPPAACQSPGDPSQCPGCQAIQSARDGLLGHLTAEGMPELFLEVDRLRSS